MRHVMDIPRPRALRLSPATALLAALCLVGGISGSARADFGSSDPADWVRNRCVSRNVMLVGLLSAPVGLVLIRSDEQPAHLGLGAAMIAASGGTLATGITLRVLQPAAPNGVNTPYAQWARNGCLLRSVAIYGGPIMALGALALANARMQANNPFGHAFARIMTITGVAMLAGGLTMTLYGSLRVRRRDGQPAMDLGAPLVAFPVRGGSLSLGAGSLGFSGAF